MVWRWHPRPCWCGQVDRAAEEEGAGMYVIDGTGGGGYDGCGELQPRFKLRASTETYNKARIGNLCIDISFIDFIYPNFSSRV